MSGPFTPNYVYLKIRENTLEACNLSTGHLWQTATAKPDKPFTTERQLVGSFSHATPLLAALIDKVVPRGIIRRSPAVLIHPIDKVGTGLSEIEERVLVELVMGAGAYRVKIHTGDELSNKEAKDLLCKKP